DPLSYQWYYGGTTQPIMNQISANFYSPGPGTYYVVVSNACGSATSRTVTITFCDTPGLIGEPNDHFITQGQTVSLGVTAYSGSSMSFQWFTSDGQPIMGANSDLLTVTPSVTTG